MSGVFGSVTVAGAVGSYAGDFLTTKVGQYVMHDLRHLHGGVSLEPEMSVQSARVMVGLSTRFFGSASSPS